MKLTTKMFLALVVTVVFLSAVQYVLVQIEHGRIKGYAASFGGSAPGLQAAGAGFFNNIISAERGSASKASPEQYNHENFYCTQNVCSFTVAKKSLLMKPVTIVIDKNTLADDCIATGGAKVSAGICQSLKDGGWDIIHGK